MVPENDPSKPDSAPSKAWFPSTRWTIVSDLGNRSQNLRFLAWDEFCRSYQRPLFLWLHAKTGDSQLAEETVQSFFTKLHLKDHWVESVDPAKGRLRSWLLSALRRHWIDGWRSSAPAMEEIPEDTPAPADSSVDLYDREWALSLFKRVVAGLSDEYQARGKSSLFAALLEALDSPSQIQRNDVCRKLGISANHFSVAFMRFRERLAVRLREEVAGTVIDQDPAEIDGELRHLIGILARQGAISNAAGKNPNH